MSAKRDVFAMDADDLDTFLLRVVNNRTRDGRDAFVVREFLITLRDIRALPDIACADFDWETA